MTHQLFPTAKETSDLFRPRRSADEAVRLHVPLSEYSLMPRNQARILARVGTGEIEGEAVIGEEVGEDIKEITTKLTELFTLHRKTESTKDEIRMEKTAVTKMSQQRRNKRKSPPLPSSTSPIELTYRHTNLPLRRCLYYNIY